MTISTTEAKENYDVATANVRAKTAALDAARQSYAALTNRAASGQMITPDELTQTRQAVTDATSELEHATLVAAAALRHQQEAEVHKIEARTVAFQAEGEVSLAAMAAAAGAADATLGAAQSALADFYATAQRHNDLVSRVDGERSQLERFGGQNAVLAERHRSVWPQFPRISHVQTDRIEIVARDKFSLPMGVPDTAIGRTLSDYFGVNK